MTSRQHTSPAPLLAAAVVACGLSCKGPGNYVWVDAYASAGEPGQSYVIAPGDLIQVRVFNQEQLSTRARVRGDGKISLPLVNDVSAAGLTPGGLAKDLEVRLTDFVKTPLVTVSLEETRPPNIYVIGEVTKPGVYPLETALGVLTALVNAGGLTQNARSDRIFVLRQGPPETRIRFTYDALVRLEGKATSFRLRPGDVVVVE